MAREGASERRASRGWSLTHANDAATKHGNVALARDTPAARAGIAALMRNVSRCERLDGDAGASSEAIGSIASSSHFPRAPASSRVVSAAVDKGVQQASASPRGGPKKDRDRVVPCKVDSRSTICASPDPEASLPHSRLSTAEASGRHTKPSTSANDDLARAPAPAPIPGQRLGMSLLREIEARRLALRPPLPDTPVTQPGPPPPSTSQALPPIEPPRQEPAVPSSPAAVPPLEPAPEPPRPRHRSPGVLAPDVADLARALRIRVHGADAWSGLSRLRGAVAQVRARALAERSPSGRSRAVATEELLSSLTCALSLSRLPEELLAAACAASIEEVHGWDGMTQEELQAVLDCPGVKRVDLQGHDVTIALSGRQARRHGAGLTIRHQGTELCNGRLWFEPAFSQPARPALRGGLDRMCAELADELRTMDGSMTREHYARNRLEETQHVGQSCMLAVQAPGVRLCDLRIEGSGARQAGAVAVLATRFCRGLLVMRCSVSSFHCGILLSAGSEGQLADVTVARSGGCGVEVAGTAVLRVDGLVVERAGAVGVSVKGAGSRLRGGTVCVRQVRARRVGLRRGSGPGRMPF